MNSNRLFAILMATTMSATVFAETETESNTKAVEQTEASKLNMDNGVIPIADDRGFTLQSNDGSFVFKPYLFMQTTANFKYYDDEGLDKAYNQDNVANSGFAIPYAIIGFTGKAFGKIDYNVCVNAAASGGNILQQAWIDYAVCPELRFRAGKFKTPFTHAYLTTLGETSHFAIFAQCCHPRHWHRFRSWCRDPWIRCQQVWLSGRTLEWNRQRSEWCYQDHLRRSPYSFVALCWSSDLSAQGCHADDTGKPKAVA